MATCDPADGQLRLVIVGHVDHGKSTLIGRLFHDTDSMPDGRMAQLAAAAKRRGAPFEFANLVDALQAERDQNVTIDTAQIWFRWRGRSWVIIDAPGHKQFLKNMVTGTAQADAAVLLVDAAEGVQDQTRRHAFLLNLLGIRQVVVAVNKMDLVDYGREPFERVATDMRRLLGDVDLAPADVVPMSAAVGDNVAHASARLAWFEGPTLLGALERLARVPPLDAKPLRFPVQDVYRFDHRRIVAGRVEAGVVRVGDPLLFLPSGQRSAVKTIERWGAASPALASAGDSIGITLSEQLFIDRGEVACHADRPAAVAATLRARVFWLGQRPLTPGRSYVIRLATQEAACRVTAIDRVVDAATLQERDDVSGLASHDVADVTIQIDPPLVFDRYDDVATLGRFVLVDDLDVAGGGVILDAGRSPDAVVPRTLVRVESQVTREERHARQQHQAAVVWLTGLPGAGKSTLATALERELFDRGVQAFVLDGDNIRHGLTADLGFSMADRVENIRRVAEVAKLFAEAGMVAITAFISPYRSDRLRARRIVQEGGLGIPFTEVFVDAPLDVCERRDPKHLYARARAGEIKEFTGVSAPYEMPEDPDLVVRTHESTVEEAVARVLDHLLPQIR